MKKHFLVLAILCFASISYAQKSLKGPQAKNYHPLLHQKDVLPQTQKSSYILKGPQAKNRKAIHAKKSIATNSRKQLKGPRAKNRKVIEPTAPPSMALNNFVRALPGLLFGRPY